MQTATKAVLSPLAWLLRTIEGFLYMQIGYHLSNAFGWLARRVESVYEDD
jgi:hypothetical protein